MAPDNTQQIRLEAYYIWEREGRPDGRALEHWLAAEHNLGTEHGLGTEPLEGEVGSWQEATPVEPVPQPAPAAAATVPRPTRTSPAEKPARRPRGKVAAKDQPST